MANASVTFSPLITEFSQSGKRNLVEMAEEEDWIGGYRWTESRVRGHGKLIYAMRVTKKIPLSRYLNSPRYADRADRFTDDHNVHGRFALISEDYYYKLIRCG